MPSSVKYYEGFRIYCTNRTIWSERRKRSTLRIKEFDKCLFPIGNNIDATELTRCFKSAHAQSLLSIVAELHRLHSSLYIRTGNMYSTYWKLIWIEYDSRVKCSRHIRIFEIVEDSTFGSVRVEPRASL